MRRRRWSRSRAAVPPRSSSRAYEFAVEDAAGLTLPDGSVDGIICRFGLMLVPDMESATAEIARVLRPGGRRCSRSGRAPRVNPWITAGGRAAVDLGFADPPEYDAPGPFRLGDRRCCAR